MFDPGEIRTGSGGLYRVFTPFARACRARPMLPPIPAPAALPPAPRLASEALESWHLRPRGVPDWARGFSARFTPGEVGARAALGRFVAGGLAEYATRRDRPDREGTSLLSPHLHFGEISPGRAWEAGAASARFGDELLWREFSAHLLAAHPDLPERPLRREFENFPWRDDPAALAAWQRGETGIPIVDAGMRQLWATGWMHNRVRMIAASFLVKHLLIPWQAGQAWFWDTLLDADLASNAASWQWVAGCGADAAPYFRIFNPVLQGEKFDPDGAYVRAWVPELAALPARWIHRPWEAPTPPRAYPPPCIALAAGRARALAAFAALRGKASRD
jgi:deoxyribodipyrimidine photo-lyase